MKKRYPLKKTLLVPGLYIVSLLLGVFALGCFYGYGREVIASFGSNDKSLLFWYLPILFMGVIAAQGAIASAVIAWRQSRKD